MVGTLRLALVRSGRVCALMPAVVSSRGLQSEPSRGSLRRHESHESTWTPRTLEVSRKLIYKPAATRQLSWDDQSPQWVDNSGKPVDSIWKEGARRLTLVDGKAAVYRAYYGASSSVSKQTAVLIDNSTGAQNTVDTTWTVINTINALVNLMELGPTHMAVVFDSEGLTFRHGLLLSYKGHRKPQPDTVRQALPILRHLVTAMGIQTLEVTGVEADDVIGTLTTRAVAAGMEVCISSPDKDFMALLCPSVRLLQPRKKGGGAVLFEEKDFISKFQGLSPSQFLDMLALMGDTSDNIPGVPGIGPKTASVLIREHGTLEALLERCVEVKASKIREGLLENGKTVLEHRDLMRIRTALPLHMVKHQPHELALAPPSDDGRACYAALDALNMNLNLPAMARLKIRLHTMWESMMRA